MESKSAIRNELNNHLVENGAPLLPQILDDARIIACVGSGGVGKTTLAAALGITLAKTGKRVIVITIDPAKRLADALRLGKMDSAPKEIERELLASYGVTLPENGSLSAMMLDVRSVWNSLIERYAKNEEQKKAIFENPFYRRLRSSLAGSNEYMALEKLYELSRRKDIDAIVLDTPPSVHALDFLDAPQKLVDLLNNQAIKFFTIPYKLGGKAGMRVMNLTNTMIMKRLAEMTGTELLKSLAEFMVAFEGMYDGFKERAEKVSALMRSEKTVFLIISAPTEGAVEEAGRLYGAVSERAITFGAFIVNQMHPRAMIPESDGELSELRREFLALGQSAGLSESDWEILWRNARYGATLWRNDMEKIKELKKFGMGKSRIIGVPRYPEGIGGVEMLSEISNRLWRATEL